jgi:hypothetical protein
MVLSTGAGFLLGILIAIAMVQELGIRDRKIWVEKDGYVDFNAKESVCAGYRDVEAE